jgi:hypothetical protein
LSFFPTILKFILYIDVLILNIICRPIRPIISLVFFLISLVTKKNLLFEDLLELHIICSKIKYVPEYSPYYYCFTIIIFQIYLYMFFYFTKSTYISCRVQGNMVAHSLTKTIYYMSSYMSSCCIFESILIVLITIWFRNLKILIVKCLLKK